MEQGGRGGEGLMELLSQLRRGLAAGGANMRRFHELLRQLEDGAAHPPGQRASGALEELLELLNMGSEQTLLGFQPAAFVPALAKLLAGGSMEIRLLAARVCTATVDVLPDSARALASSALLVAVHECLHHVEALELVEQSLLLLEKMSATRARALARVVTAAALLQYVDFFPLHVQRGALLTLARMAPHLSLQRRDGIAAVVPSLRGFLAYDDAKVVQHSVEIFHGAARAFAAADGRNPPASRIFSPELLAQLTALARRPVATEAARALRAHVLDTLSKAAARSAVLAEDLVPAFAWAGPLLAEPDAVEPVLLFLLALLPPGFKLPFHPWTVARLHQLESGDVFPHETSLEDSSQPMMEDDMAGEEDEEDENEDKDSGEDNEQNDEDPRHPTEDEDEEDEEEEEDDEKVEDTNDKEEKEKEKDTNKQNIQSKKRNRKNSSSTHGMMPSMAQVGLEEGESKVARRARWGRLDEEGRHKVRLYLERTPAEFVAAYPELMRQLVDVGRQASHPRVQALSLALQLKATQMYPASQLAAALADVPLSTNLARMLASSDTWVVQRSLQLARLLLARLPSESASAFRREGVHTALLRLSQQSTPSSAQEWARRLAAHLQELSVEESAAALAVRQALAHLESCRPEGAESEASALASLAHALPSLTTHEFGELHVASALLSYVAERSLSPLGAAVRLFGALVREEGAFSAALRHSVEAAGVLAMRLAPPRFGEAALQRLETRLARPLTLQVALAGAPAKLTVLVDAMLPFGRVAEHVQAYLRRNAPNDAARLRLRIGDRWMRADDPVLCGLLAQRPLSEVAALLDHPDDLAAFWSSPHELMASAIPSSSQSSSSPPPKQSVFRKAATRNFGGKTLSSLDGSPFLEEEDEHSMVVEEEEDEEEDEIEAEEMDAFRLLVGWPVREEVPKGFPEKEDGWWDALLLVRLLSTLQRRRAWVAELGARMGLADLQASGAALSAVSGPLSAAVREAARDWASALLGHRPPWLNALVRRFRPLLAREDRSAAAAALMDRSPVRRVAASWTIRGLTEAAVAEKLPSLRIRATVRRGHVFADGIALLADSARSSAVLEVAFEGEEGTGTGPTAEFFGLMGRGFQRTGLGLWRSDARRLSDAVTESLVQRDERDESTLRTGASSSWTLHPQWAPKWDAAAEDRAAYRGAFRSVGRCVARMVQDGRWMELPLSAAYAARLAYEPVGVAEVAETLDLTGVGKVLRGLYCIWAVDEVARAEGRALPAHALLYMGTDVESLQIPASMQVLGHSLREEDPSSGVDTDESLKRASQCGALVQATVRAVAFEEVADAVEGWRRGAAESMRPQFASMWSGEEWVDRLAGHPAALDAAFDRAQLAAAVQFAHGYTANCPTAQRLLDVLAALSHEDRARFVQFVTGAPVLPLGGFAALKPPLTVVRKGDDSPAALAELPSAMTCANFLKLPAYPSLELLKEKLLFSLREGAFEFGLS